MIASEELCDTLINLINNANKHPENSVIEYKIKPHSKGHDCELFKDILGLLNSCDRPNEDRWLIYGVTNKGGYPKGFDKKDPDCLDDANYQEKFKKISNKPFIEFISLDGNLVLGPGHEDIEFAAFYIPAVNVGKVYELASDIEDKEPNSKDNKVKYFRGMSFIRRGSTTCLLDEEGRQRIRQVGEGVKLSRTHAISPYANSAFPMGSQASGGVSLDDLSILAAIGRWNEACEKDQGFIANICNRSYHEVVKALREMSSSRPGFTLQNNVWSITDRDDAAGILAARFNGTILSELAPRFAEVLSEVDGTFNLEKDKRVFAAFYKVNQGHSKALKCGIAEFCAHLSNNRDMYCNCASADIDKFLHEVMVPVVCSPHWRSLASSEFVFPLFAEADPSLYLTILLRATKDGVIHDLMAESDNGLMGLSLGYDVIRGIEVAAQDGHHLSDAINLLVEMSSFTELAVTSMTRILLPWMPQTNASAKVREGIGKYFARNGSEGAWKALLALLPNKTTSSAEPWKTRFRSPIELPQVTLGEYREVEKSYCDSAIAACKGKPVRAAELAGEVQCFRAIGCMSEFAQGLSDICAQFDDEQRYPVWVQIEGYLNKCRRYPDAAWHPKPKQLNILIGLVNTIRPDNPYYHALRILSTADFELIDSRENRDAESQKILKQRAEAIDALLKSQGNDVIPRLIADGAKPWLMGAALGERGLADEVAFLKNCFTGDLQSPGDSLAAAYVSRRQIKLGWSWIDSLNLEYWDSSLIGELYSALPCEPETWQRIERRGAEASNNYWRLAREYFSAKDINAANHYAKMKLEVNEPAAAIFSLFAAVEQGHSPDVELVFEALEAYNGADSGHIDSYYIDGLFEFLEQVAPGERLARCEWKLFEIIEPPRQDAYLFQCISKSPELFCTVIKYCLGEDVAGGSSDSELTSKLRSHAYSVLRSWNLPPGLDDAGKFSARFFNGWISRVYDMLPDSEARKCVDTILGRNLFHSQADTDCLFIDPVIADYYENHEAARRGFSMESVNSREAEIVDPTGAPEDDIAESYEAKAVRCEEAGYILLASMVRGVAEDYRGQAQRIRDEGI